MILAHVIALDPTCKQANALARAAGCARFAYNWGLAEWERQYKAGLKPNAFGVRKAFNVIKGTEFPWIYDSPKDANQEAFSDLGVAFKNFFESRSGKRKGPPVGYPTRRKRGRKDSFYVSSDRLSFKGSHLVRLPVIGNVKTSEELRFKGKILGATVSKKAGRWYLSVQVDCEARVPNDTNRAVLGIDLGLKTAIVTSAGEEIQAPKPLKAALYKLKRANRTLHRRIKGSVNRKKAALKVAKIHAKIANIRKDFLHKVTYRLARENQTIVIEDLNVRGMLRNHKLARAISDVGFGKFRVFLTYKTERFGTRVIVADRWFPSSKRCHGCGKVKETLDLSERTYMCDNCGLVEDRDRNASINLEMYPGLPGNTTPVDTRASASRKRKVSSVVEAGTNPCSLTGTT